MFTGKYEWGDVEFLTRSNLIDEHIAEKLSRIYIFGHRLDYTLKARLFQRLGFTVDHSFCYEAAAAVMLGLKGYENSCFVFGEITRDDGSNDIHAWVEVDFGNDEAIIIDPIAVNSEHDQCHDVYCTDRELFYKDVAPKVKYIVTYDEFWGYDLSHELYDLLSSQEKSVSFSLLLSAYRPYQYYHSQPDLYFPSSHFKGLVLQIAGNRHLQQKLVQTMDHFHVWPFDAAEKVNHIMQDPCGRVY